MPENQKWTVSDFASKKEIIKSGMGWGGLPGHLIEEELEAGELVVLDLDHYPVRHSQLMVMRLRDSVLGPVGQALWQRIAE
jgi:DNA-binding transcriptional LysR family regulator